MAMVRVIAYWTYITDLIVYELQPLIIQAIELLKCIDDLMITSAFYVLQHFLKWAILLESLLSDIHHEIEFAIGWYIRFETFTLLI